MKIHKKIKYIFLAVISLLTLIILSILILQYQYKEQLFVGKISDYYNNFKQPNLLIDSKDKKITYLGEKLEGSNDQRLYSVTYSNNNKIALDLFNFNVEDGSNKNSFNVRFGYIDCSQDCNKLIDILITKNAANHFVNQDDLINNVKNITSYKSLLDSEFPTTNDNYWILNESGSYFNNTSTGGFKLMKLVKKNYDYLETNTLHGNIISLNNNIYISDTSLLKFDPDKFSLEKILSFSKDDLSANISPIIPNDNGAPTLKIYAHKILVIFDLITVSVYNTETSTYSELLRITPNVNNIIIPIITNDRLIMTTVDSVRIYNANYELIKNIDLKKYVDATKYTYRSYLSNKDANKLIMNYYTQNYSLSIDINNGDIIESGLAR